MANTSGGYQTLITTWTAFNANVDDEHLFSPWMKLIIKTAWNGLVGSDVVVNLYGGIRQRLHIFSYIWETCCVLMSSCSLPCSKLKESKKYSWISGTCLQRILTWPSLKGNLTSNRLSPVGCWADFFSFHPPKNVLESGASRKRHTPIFIKNTLILQNKHKIKLKLTI